MSTAKGQPQVVRIFPDYAETVLWFGGPVAYRFSGLTSGLVRDLKGWEQSYYASLTPVLEWKSAELLRQFTIEGNDLASRVAQELGNGYEVALKSYETGVPPSRFRATGAGRNPQAVAAFDELTATLSAEQDKTASSAAAHSREDREWLAFAPISGVTFKPDR